MARPHDETIELLLASITADVGDDGMMSCFPIDRSKLVGGVYATIFFSQRRLVEAALFARQHGASYLRALSISDICEMLRDFIKDNYQPIAEQTLFRPLKGTFSHHVSPENKHELAEALEQSALFSPTNQVALFPLVTVKVEADFSCESFFFRAPATLHQELPEELNRRLVPDRFPPAAGSRFRSETPASWLGIRSPSLESSRKMLRAILGAVALTPFHTYRHMFSGRNMWGGHLVLGGEYSLSFGDAVTPPLMEDIVITAADHDWLKILGEKVGADSPTIRRQMIALEYYYRAWGLSLSERFPILCMALDATYGKKGSSKVSIIKGVQDTNGPLNEDRLEALLQLRNAVIHGDAPDVYDSPDYASYSQQYGEDAIDDMDILLTACLRQKIFEGALVEHVEPHQHIVHQARAAGRIPRARTTSTILDPA